MWFQSWITSTWLENYNFEKTDSPYHKYRYPTLPCCDLNGWPHSKFVCRRDYLVQRDWNHNCTLLGFPTYHKLPIYSTGRSLRNTLPQSFGLANFSRLNIKIFNRLSTKSSLWASCDQVNLGKVTIAEPSGGSTRCYELDRSECRCSNQVYWL